jgi:hypothetical protein
MHKDPTGKYDMTSLGVYRLGIAHYTSERAIRSIKELGLEGAYPISMGEAPRGRRFQKIIVLYDFSKYPRGKAFLLLLRTQIEPGGYLVDLSW